MVCIATYNYKAVYSWNEIFNNETGRQVLIITGLDGKAGSIGGWPHRNHLAE